jgi:F0F1-type ATP synthase assembly protein I
VIFAVIYPLGLIFILVLGSLAVAFSLMRAHSREGERRFHVSAAKTSDSSQRN